MFRKLICATFVMTVCIGLVAAEEFTASIKKIDGNKVTFTKVAGGFGKNKKKDDTKKPEETTLTVASDAKIAKGKFSLKDKKASFEVGDALEGGLKNEAFKTIDEKKGRFVRITTSDDNKTITQILLFGTKKKTAD